MSYRDYIEVNPNVCGGQPVVRGTRVIIRTILASLADGDTDESLLLDFPAMTPDALRALIAYAAATAVGKDDPLPPLPPLPAWLEESLTEIHPSDARQRSSEEDT